MEQPRTRLQTWLPIVLSVGAMAVVLMFTFVLFAIKHTQDTGSPVIRALAAQQDAIAQQQDDLAKVVDNTSQTNEQILDCTTPKGKCSKRNQAATAATVGSLNAVTVQSASCAVEAILADHIETPTHEQIEKAIRRCVYDGLHPHADGQ